MALILPNHIQNAIPADGDKLGQNFATIEDWANQEAISRDGSTGMTGPLLLPGPPTEPNQAATKAYVDSAGPIGSMMMFGGDTEPAGWMLCRGQAISRATYAALYVVLGDKYGAGDGSTTFNLPSMQGRAPVGHWPGGQWAATNGQMIGSADLPAHAHGMKGHVHHYNHAHYVAEVGTGWQSANHTHGITGVGSGAMGSGFATGILAALGESVFQDTRGVSDNHYHTVNAHHTRYVNEDGSVGVGAGNGGSANTHGPNDNTTDTAGSGTLANGNIGPSTVVNFIIKVA